jgi:hypothetical protein
LGQVTEHYMVIRQRNTPSPEKHKPLSSGTIRRIVANSIFGELWTPEEDAVLCATFPSGGPKTTKVHFPHRTIRAITDRARRLRQKYIHRKTLPSCTWTGAEVTKLMRMWNASMRQEIEAAIPRHSWDTITSKAHALKLFRSPHVRYPLKEAKHPILKEIQNRMRELKVYGKRSLRNCRTPLYHVGMV